MGYTTSRVGIHLACRGHPSGPTAPRGVPSTLGGSLHARSYIPIRTRLPQVLLQSSFRAKRSRVPTISWRSVAVGLAFLRAGRGTRAALAYGSYWQNPKDEVGGGGVFNFCKNCNLEATKTWELMRLRSLSSILRYMGHN